MRSVSGLFTNSPNRASTICGTPSGPGGELAALSRQSENRSIVGDQSSSGKGFLIGAKQNMSRAAEGNREDASKRRIDIV